MAEQHAIDIDPFGNWKIKHPAACPLLEHDCPVSRAAEQIVDPDTEAGQFVTAGQPGRFLVELGPLDQLLIGHAVVDEGIQQPANVGSSVQLSLSPTGGSVVIDGVDLADAVTAVQVYSDARHMPQVVLTMPIRTSPLEVDGEQCQVELLPATHDALIELGWTPPSPEVAAAKEARLDFYAQRHITKLGLTLASRLLAQLETYWPSDGELERWRELLDVLVADNFALDPEHDSTAPGGVTDLHGTGRGIHGHHRLNEPLCEPCALLFDEMQRAGLVREVARCAEQAAHGGPCNEPVNDGYCAEHGRIEPSINTITTTSEGEEDVRGQRHVSGSGLHGDGDRDLRQQEDVPGGRQGSADAGRRNADPLTEDISDEVLTDLLSLVCVTVPAERIAAWTPEQREQAADWAGATHLQASDNDVTVPARPAFLDAS